MSAPTLPERRQPIPSARESAAAKTAPPDTETVVGIAVDSGHDRDRPMFRPQDAFVTLVKNLRVELPPGVSPRMMNVLGFSGFGKGIVAAVVGVSYLRIATDLNISDKALIYAGDITVIGSVLVAQFFSFAADRFNRLKMLAIITVLFGAAALLLGLVQTAAIFLFSKVLQDILGGFTLTSAPTVSLLSDAYPPEVRGRVIGREASIGTLAGIVVAPVAGVVVHAVGYPVALTVTSILAIASAAIFTLVRHPERGYWDRIRLGASDAGATRKEKPPSLAEAWRGTRSVRTLRRICYAQSFLQAGGVALIPVLLIVQRQTYGSDPLIIGFITGASLVATLAGVNAAGILADRLLKDRPQRVLPLLGFVILGNTVALFFIALLSSVYVLIPFILIQAFVSQLPNTGRDILVSQITPPRLRTFGIQLPQLFGLLGLLTTPFAVAIAGQNPTTGVLLFASVFLAIGAVILITSATDVAKDMQSARLSVLAAEQAVGAGGDGGSLLVCRGVDIAYDGVQVLFGVDFDVVEGELVALLGTNGAGKSSLLRAISGLSEPVGGAVFFDGRDVTHLPAHELAKLGVVQMPGGKGVFPTLTVEENLRTAGWLDPAGLDGKLTEVYAAFPRLRDRRGTFAGALSGGEQQMVALGQAFVMKPRILLIDELSLGLAPAVVEELLRAVTRLHDSGMTVIIVEQSVDLALTVATRAVFMEKGEVRFSGSAAELRDRPELLRSVYLKGTRNSAGRAAGEKSRAGASARAATAVEVLRARDVAVSFGGIQALDGASLHLRAGEIVGLIGPNGAGKTTLFDVLSGFVSPSSGSVELAGRDVTGLDARQRAGLGLARSFQDARLFPALSVLDNIRVALQADATRPAEVLAALWLPQMRNAERLLARKAEALVEQYGLAEFRDAAPSELSTGQRRVLDLACQVAAGPDVLLLDEPSSGIAQAEAEELGPLIDSVRRDLGCGILVIEHDVALLASIADRMVGMVLGRTIADGSYAEVTGDPVMVEAYLGRSSRVLQRSKVTTSTSERQV